MNAAIFFGQHYTEATRKPGQPRRPGMKTLADQTHEKEAGRKIKFQCECGETNIVRLPEQIQLVRADEAKDGADYEMIMDTACEVCGAEVRVSAPKGQAFVKRGAASEALHSFSRRYGRAIEASRLRHGHLPVM